LLFRSLLIKKSKEDSLRLFIYRNLHIGTHIAQRITVRST
jgi:hypothetical protein